MMNESKAGTNAVVVKVVQPDNLKINGHIDNLPVNNNNLIVYIQMNERKVITDNALDVVVATDELISVKVTVTDVTNQSHTFPFMQVG